MRPPTTLEDVARQAVDGDRDALDVLVRDLQGDIYGLALRMLWNREDAEDATQEILVRVVTRLSQFDFRSRLKTWVYRVAVNYILDVKKSAVERLHLTFDQFAEDLAEGISTDGPMDAERSLLVKEVKIGCTLGMLQCLDWPHRLAYVLGEILAIPQARSPPRPLGYPRSCFASACNTPVQRSKRLRRCTVVSPRTAQPAPAIDVCPRPFASVASVPMRSTSPSNRRHIRRFADSSAAPSRRGGRFRPIAPVSRGPRPSTSHVGWPSHSAYRVIRSRRR